jgi:hypothetical protein
MRQLIAALVVLGLPVLATAQSQSSGTSAASPSVTLPQIALPLPPIGLPLAPIGLPLPSIGFPPSPTAQRQHPETNQTFGARDQNHRRRSHAAPTVVYFGAYYPWAGESLPAPGMVAPSVAAATDEPVAGRLRLEVKPADIVQLFVDGVYVGTSDDVGDELAMEPGVRRIEIRAEGYEPLIFDARIVAGRTITYRGSLRPVAPEPPPPASTVPAPPASHPSPQSRTMYFIPGCYLGNIPPGEIKLPSGCDLSRLIIRTP